MSSSVLSSISKFKSPILTIIVLISFYIIKMELQSSAFNKRKIFGEYISTMNNTKYWSFIAIIIIDMGCFIAIMTYCVMNKFLIPGVVALGFNVFFVMILYSMLSYSHLYKRDKFPTYEMNDRTFVILDTFKDQAQVAELNTSNYNNRSEFLGLNDSDKRYIVNINNIIRNYGIYYINNSTYSNSNLHQILFISLVLVSLTGFVVLACYGVNWAYYLIFVIMFILLCLLYRWASYYEN